LIGPGTVGRVLLAQIATQIERLRALNLDLRVRGIATSKRMLLEEGAVDLDRWAERLEEAGEPLDLEKFINHVQADYMPHTVMIDCTASAEVADQYRDWLRAAFTSSRRTRRPTAARCRTTARCRRRGAPPARTICTRRRWARDCRSFKRCAICARPAMTSPDRRHFLRHAGVSVQCVRRQANRSPRSCARPRPRATPSRIRAMTCPAWMSPASSSFSGAKWG
jgi:hypothetical protein